jgi:hypothetical protein
MFGEKTTIKPAHIPFLSKNRDNNGRYTERCEERNTIIRYKNLTVGDKGLAHLNNDF